MADINPPRNIEVYEIPSRNIYFITWDDMSDGEDGYEILLDDGGFSQVGNDLDPNTEFAHVTGASSDNLDVRVRVFSGSGGNRVEASADFTAPHPNNSGYRYVIDPVDASAWGTTKVIETGLTYEHTAMHGGNPVLPSRLVDSDRDAFANIYIYVNTTRLLRGEIEKVQPDTPSRGEATLVFRGPGLELTRNGPSSTPVTYSNTPYHTAIGDYCNNEAGSTITITTHEPPTEVKSNDTKVQDATDFVQFDVIYTGPDTEPIVADDPTTEIRNTQQVLAGVENDFYGTYDTGGDASSDSYFHINSEWAEIDTGSQQDESVSLDVQLEHDINSEDVGVIIHVKQNGSGNIDGSSVTLNGTQLDTSPTGASTEQDPVTGNMVYEIFDTEYDSNNGADLTAGNTYTLTVAADTGAGDSVVWEIDYMAVYDTRYGPQTWDEPTSLGESIDGPSLYPNDITTTNIESYTRTWWVAEARIASTWDDTSNGQQIELSNDAGNSYPQSASNSDSLTADFDTAGSYGVVVQPRVTFSAYGSNTWLSQRASPQTVTGWEVYVTTKDLPIIGSAGLELKDNDFENLRSLHDPWGGIFVIDPDADGVEIESFAPGDPAVEMALDVRILDLPPPTRDVTGYGNKYTVKWEDNQGTLQDFTVEDTDEQSRVGKTITRPPEFASDVSTTDGARNRARDGLMKAIRQDESGGTLMAVADKVLPGYPYKVPDWVAVAFWGENTWGDGVWGGDPPITLTRTTFQEGTDSAEMQLQYLTDDDIVRTVVDTARGQRELEKTV